MRRLLPLALILALAGCADYGPKEFGGGLVGAGGGALLGSQFGRGSGRLAATGAGALAGGLLGMGAGRSLDRADRSYYAQPGYAQPGSYAPPSYYAPAPGYYAPPRYYGY